MVYVWNMRVVDAVPPVRTSMYPLDEWLLPDRIVELRRGEDFTITPNSLRITVAKFARRNGIKVRLRVVESSVFIDTRELS